MRLPRSPAVFALSSLGLALALNLGAPPAGAQPAAAASAASTPSFAVRPEVAAALNQAIDFYRAAKAGEARATIEKAQATIQALQPAEATVLHRVRGLVEMQLEQYAAAVQSLQAALAVGAQSAQDALQCQEVLARAHFNLKAYAEAAQAARQAQAAGSKAPAVQAVLVRATYLQDDFKRSVELLEAQRLSEGRLAPEDLRLLASAYGRLKDDANYVRLAEQLLREQGRQEYWPDLLSRVQRQPGWQPRWDIDVYRLRLQLGLMEEAEDYLVLAELATRAGLPAEAEQVLAAGFAKGVLGKGQGAAEQERLRASVRRQAEDDRASLEAAAARAPAPGDARAALHTFNTGAALVAIGRAEPGLARMRAALGASLPDADQARLQYGQALARVGRGAEAAEVFQQVAGHAQLGLLARLWALAAAAPGKR
jgi:hypothetical protein